MDRMKYRAKWWVIDIGGNNLRMLFFASFDTQKIFVKHIVCHAEYHKLMQLYEGTRNDFRCHQGHSGAAARRPVAAGQHLATGLSAGA
ncbi:type II toxin-antitoxin system HigB family toxin [Serratia ficaria]|uniref:type II toxin-antitoxin system HigB family toxin n=1 Tax=Serratia ficaria TaxID=61651 RepID=UPI0036F3CE70